MRRIYLAGSFFALVAVLCLLWAYRFERCPELPVLRLPEIRAAAPVIPGFEWIGQPEDTRLRVSLAPDGGPVAARFQLPGIPEVEMLHLKFRMNSQGLIPGTATWADGRFIIEWYPANVGGTADTTGAGSVRFDTVGGLVQFVMPAPKGLAIPALRFEHLGTAGIFEVADLELVIVKESQVWAIGKWLLLAGWIVWAAAVVCSWPGIGRGRALGAAVLWVVMGAHFAVPGPWQLQRAMVPEFRTGGEKSLIPDQSASSPSIPRNPSIAYGAIPALGKLEDEGSLALRIKMRIAPIRPLLHALLLGVPTLFMAWWIGRKPTCFLMILLAALIELAQVAFGYGFDWIDVFDLICDATGIALGLWFSRKLLSLLPSYLARWVLLSGAGSQAPLPLQQR